MKILQSQVQNSVAYVVAKILCVQGCWCLGKEPKLPSSRTPSTASHMKWMDYKLLSLGCVWIKDLVREKEIEMVDDPMVLNGWIV